MERNPAKTSPRNQRMVSSLTVRWWRQRGGGWRWHSQRRACHQAQRLGTSSAQRVVFHNPSGDNNSKLGVLAENEETALRLLMATMIARKMARRHSGKVVPTHLPPGHPRRFPLDRRTPHGRFSIRGLTWKRAPWRSSARLTGWVHDRRSMSRKFMMGPSPDSRKEINHVKPHNLDSGISAQSPDVQVVRPPFAPHLLNSSKSSGTSPHAQQQQREISQNAA